MLRRKPGKESHSQQAQKTTTTIKKKKKNLRMNITKEKKDLYDKIKNTLKK
jgi:hypothetical protein